MNEEAGYVSKAASLADARRRFAEVVARSSDLVLEKETEFWSAFRDAYVAQRPSAASSAEQAVHLQFSDEVEMFIRGKDRP